MRNIISLFIKIDLKNNIQNIPYIITLALIGLKLHNTENGFHLL